MGMFRGEDNNADPLLPSPTKASLLHFFPAVWPIVQSFLEGVGGGGRGEERRGKARFFEQKLVNGILKKSLMKTDCIGHRLTFFCFSNKEWI